jgi:VIT1/CCC1 family predicted Fe2+/Mn2+ transporter
MCSACLTTERRRDEVGRLGYDPSVIQAADHERHGAGTQTIRDLVLGMADGLTVPFALAAGVTGVVAASGIVLTAGLAEIVAGAISMGLGGYLAARSEIAHYAKEYAREIRETHEIPNEEKAEVAQILHGYGVREPVLTRVVNEITGDREQWVEFMMRNELGLERPDERAAPRSAALVGGGYVLGGIFPLAPYVFVHDAHDALYWSILCTTIALLVFGAVRARVLATPVVLGALQTWLIGVIAGGAAYGLARLVSSHGTV